MRVQISRGVQLTSFNSRTADSKPAYEGAIPSESAVRLNAYASHSRQLALNRAIADGEKARGCVDCGEKDLRVLDFDHVRGVKRAVVSMLINRRSSVRRIYEEIDKCDVRCANCHRRTTDQRRKLARGSDGQGPALSRQREPVRIRYGSQLLEVTRDPPYRSSSVVEQRPHKSKAMRADLISDTDATTGCL